VFEGLHIPAMTASAGGTKENPGKNLRQKAGLNRSILDKGWGALRTRTEQKALRHGHACLTVPAHYTSTTCPQCGLVDKDNRASRSMFVCLACGYKAHADLNAAREIRVLGITENRVPRSPDLAQQDQRNSRYAITEGRGGGPSGPSGLRLATTPFE
jgi:transposase